MAEFEKEFTAGGPVEGRGVSDPGHLSGMMRAAPRDGASSGSRAPDDAHLVRRETILLVEDDAAVRNLVRRVLQKNGYDVVEAANGIEALEICMNNITPVDLVLSDVVMPRMSGRVLVDRLLELSNKPRVLMMSGYSEDEIERHGAFPEGISFIDKPFSIAAITAKVREVLDQDD